MAALVNPCRQIWACLRIQFGIKDTDMYICMYMYVCSYLHLLHAACSEDICLE